MVREFVFCVGLPGCGKSTYIESNYEDVIHVCSKAYAAERSIDEYINMYVQSGNVIISADEIKEYLGGYYPEHPEFVHEESVKAARQHIYNIVTNCKNFDGRIILDGGGINNHYNLAIIDFFMKNSPDTNIVCLFFDTPIEVCLDRISKRERKVPVEVIYDKNLKLVKCLNNYKSIVNEFIRINYFTSKHLLLDMDGVIAAYGKSKYDIDGNKDFCCSELFLHLPPVKHIIDWVKEHFDMNDVYICTAVANSVVWEEKKAWLKDNFPEILEDHILFCGNKDYKAVFIKNYAALKKWKINDITLIDDYHLTLDKCRKLGINAVHPSNIESIVNKYQYQA